MASFGKRLFLNTVILILISLVCFGSVGCSQTNDDPASPGDDFTQTNQNSDSQPLVGNNCEEQAPLFWLWYKVPTDRVSFGEDIDVTFFFDPFYIHPDLEKYVDKCTIDMEGFYYNAKPIPDRKVVIKEYEDFSSDIYQDFSVGEYTLQGAVEEITVPSEWFSEDEGGIVFSVNIDYIDPQIDFREQTSYGVVLYYAKDYDTGTIRLFSSQYELDNRS